MYSRQHVVEEIYMNVLIFLIDHSIVMFKKNFQVGKLIFVRLFSESAELWIRHYNFSETLKFHTHSFRLFSKWAVKWDDIFNAIHCCWPICLDKISDCIMNVSCCWMWESNAFEKANLIEGINLQVKFWKFRVSGKFYSMLHTLSLVKQLLNKQVGKFTWIIGNSVFILHRFWIYLNDGSKLLGTSSFDLKINTNIHMHEHAHSFSHSLALALCFFTSSQLAEFNVCIQSKIYVQNDRNCWHTWWLDSKQHFTFIEEIFQWEIETNNISM